MRYLMMLVVMVMAVTVFGVAQDRISEKGQTTTPNKAIEKDVLRCWAVTQSGNRCKRRAALECRYCKQHSAERIQKRKFSRCRSILTNEVQCSNAPLPSKNYCQKHLK